jgi:hypothetical protein
MRDDFQVLHTPVVGISPHSRKDFLGVGHDPMVPNTAPVNNTGWLTGAGAGGPGLTFGGGSAALCGRLAVRGRLTDDKRRSSVPPSEHQADARDERARLQKMRSAEGRQEVV